MQQNQFYALARKIREKFRESRKTSGPSHNKLKKTLKANKIKCIRPSIKIKTFNNESKR